MLVAMMSLFVPASAKAEFTGLNADVPGGPYVLQSEEGRTIANGMLDVVFEIRVIATKNCFVGGPPNKTRTFLKNTMQPDK